MSPNIILYSTADWDNLSWTNKQHMAVHLARRGYKILYVESLGLRRPQLKSKDFKRIFKRILSFLKGAKEVEKNIWVFSPIVIPLGRFKLIQVLNALILKLSIQFYKFKLGFDQHLAWTYNPTIAELITSFTPQMIIYHNVDDLSASPGIDPDWIKTEELKLLKKADLVFCTSRKLYESVKAHAKEKVHYHSNVVDYDHFTGAKTFKACPEELESIPKPHIGFIGAISSYKVDFTELRKSALDHKDYHFILIGNVGEGQPDTSISDIDLPNIHLLGAKRYEELPKYLSCFDVAIIPCPVNEYTQSMFPMKFFEYLAAGKNVVARNIDSLQDFGDVYWGYDQDLGETVKTALERGHKNAALGDELAREHTWEKRLDKMLELIKNSHPET